MFSRSFLRVGAVVLGLFAAAFVLFFSAGSLRSQAVPRARIGSIDAARTVAVARTAHPMARPQFDAGRLEPQRQLGHLALNFRLSPAQQADLDELLREQQDPASPQFHHWLSPDEYASRFGMSQSDLAKVAAWLTSAGLTVESISRNRNEIFFSGTVRDLERVFKTELHNYAVNGETHFANSTDISLPEAFASQVLSVRGLNNFQPKPAVHKLSPQFTSNVTGNHFVIPGDFAVIYDIPSTYDGTGQTIAIIGQTTINTSDIAAFRSAAGLPAATSTNFVQTFVPNTGTAAECPNDEVEADVDLEWSEGVAKNANLNYIYAGLGTPPTTGPALSCTNRNAGVLDSLEYAVTNAVAPIISISYALCEPVVTSSDAQAFEQLAQQANTQGQTIAAASGDSGAAGCDTNVSSAANGLAVSLPASVPEVTALGGTEFVGDKSACPPIDPATGAGGCPTTGAPGDPPYWSGATTATSGTTALEYIPEEAWNDTALAANGTLSATGGGVSIFYAKPAWQTGAGVPSDGARDVPDISLNSAGANDPDLICSQADYVSLGSTATSCANGFRDSGGGVAPIAGTSIATPNFAGILALISQATSSKGLGNVNPMLYQLAASTPSAFHDITTGDNKVPCTAPSTDCPTGTTSIGYSAGPGYDLVTGLGSVDVSKLINAWKGIAPASDFSIAAQMATAAAGAKSATSMVTLTSSGGFTGTVNLTCSATSPVSCSLNPTSVTLSAANPTQSSTMMLTVTSADLRLPHRRTLKPLWLELSGGVFAVALLGGVQSRRRWAVLVFAVVLATIFFTAVGCGGAGASMMNSSSSSPPQQPKQGSQTYTVIVTGMGMDSSGAPLNHSATVTFTVP